MAKNATQPSLSKGRMQCFCPEHLPARAGLQEDAVWLGLRLSTNRILLQRRTQLAPECPVLKAVAAHTFFLTYRKG